MVITTVSGSRYQAEVATGEKGPRLLVRKDGWDRPAPAVAIFQDRVPYLEATTNVSWDGRQAIGTNSRGVVTLRLDPVKVCRGMILANRKGLRSTEIVSVE
jgi:hypothetical protein